MPRINKLYLYKYCEMLSNLFGREEIILRLKSIICIKKNKSEQTSQNMKMIISWLVISNSWCKYFYKIFLRIVNFHLFFLKDICASSFTQLVLSLNIIS